MPVHTGIVLWEGNPVWVRCVQRGRYGRKDRYVRVCLETPYLIEVYQCVSYCWLNIYSLAQRESYEALIIPFQTSELQILGCFLFF